jgi:very-short-patch-repair endonuclease
MGSSPASSCPSSLERAFLRLVRAAGLPEPDTQRHLNGHRVEFYWPKRRLVVEVDGRLTFAQG